MSKYTEQAKVVSQQKLQDGIYSLVLSTDNIANEARCGQFISLYTHDGAKLLPRPISICEVDGSNLRLVYRVVGFGTEEFSRFTQGDMVKVIGPLGNGFTIRDRKPVLVAGGIGIPPMLELAKTIKRQYPDMKVTAVLGYRDSNTFLLDDMKKYADVIIATDDGSLGVHGNVIDAIKKENIEAGVFYACGPMPMLKGLKSYAEERGIEAQISLEEKMACGIGACLACVCKTKNIDEHSHVNNARICKDGPVFDSREVEL
jgi:dihydroorotate dehydrogenase electron transfer subunit